MRLLLYKTTMKKIYKVTIMVYAIIFIIGYLGGFKYMNIVLNHYIEYSDYIMSVSYTHLTLPTIA